ncbi:hypothetical protein C8F04DRAFT_1088044 [Mycena alexandri]|uniref:MYND-type domain-containing protein n=1 Tax=Mycena alexandri TaxID=1745969 RepID=A0AAD6T514_9AGAR|nr:hypothetical protein C8F04DRAFT_1088044 [Mycena alexandri]
MEILHYMESRLKSLPFGEDTEKARLWKTIVQPCTVARTSRLLRTTGVAEHVTVPGAHGLQLRISDVYSALGYIITETDRRSYSAEELENPGKLNDIHHKILAHFGKWVNILATHFDEDPNDTMPTTVCIMFGNTTDPLSSAPPMLMAVFPNLSGAFKDEGLKLQKDNLDGIKPGLRFSNKLSPEQKKWLEKAFGHCSETLGWLYLIDPQAVIPECFLYGLTVMTSVFRSMTRYSVSKTKAALRSPCPNCIYTIRSINEALQSGRAFAAFRYSDQTPVYTDNARVGIITPGPQGSVCARRGCGNTATSEFRCYCRILWFCSQNCYNEEWARHCKSCPHFQFCSWPEYRSPTSAKLPCAGPCSSRPGKVPARYCNPDHRDKDLAAHQSWCSSKAIKAEPRTREAMEMKSKAMYRLGSRA